MLMTYYSLGSPSDMQEFQKDHDLVCDWISVCACVNPTVHVFSSKLFRVSTLKWFPPVAISDEVQVYVSRTTLISFTC